MNFILGGGGGEAHGSHGRKATARGGLNSYLGGGGGGGGGGEVGSVWEAS